MSLTWVTENSMVCVVSTGKHMGEVQSSYFNSRPYMEFKDIQIYPSLSYSKYYL